MQMAVSVIRVIWWSIDLVLTLTGKMMPAMDMMALGMLLEACWSLFNQHRHQA